MVRSTRNGAAAEPAAGPHEIRPTAVYVVDDARRIFRLKQSTIRREVREGRLRISKRAGRYFLLGRWLIEWIEAGELPRRRPGKSGNGQREETARG
jgi:hypothetical protein